MIIVLIIALALVGAFAWCVFWTAVDLWKTQKQAYRYAKYKTEQYDEEDPVGLAYRDMMLVTILGRKHV